MEDKQPYIKTTFAQDDSVYNFPRIRDLPEQERESFCRWLSGQTVPWFDNLPISEQDGYFRWDYMRWKKRLPVID